VLRSQSVESSMVEVATAGRDRAQARLRATGTSFTS
jgi:hypothetical protein